MDWLKIVETAGVPLAILGAVSLVLWKVGIWLGLYIIKPVTERHVQFLDEIRDALKIALADNRKNMRNASRISKSLREVADKIENVALKMKDVHNIIVNADNVLLNPVRPKSTPDVHIPESDPQPPPAKNPGGRR